MKSSQMFDVDREGLRKLLERRGKGAIVAELISNAWDEPGVTRVTVKLAKLSGRPLAKLIVEDDSPNGFVDLSHAWTLFAESVKKGNPDQRGRFNLGEKLVLAFCQDASIATTTGTVTFNGNGRQHFPRRKRTRGSVFEAHIRMNQEEYYEVEDFVGRLIVPDEIKTIFNGQTLVRKMLVDTFDATLQTEVADDEGVLRRTTRATTVRLFVPGENETPHLYELGVPVVEFDGKYHVDVGQKVPLNMERDNVTPAYARKLHTYTFNRVFDELDGEDMNEAWVAEATADPEVADEAITAYADKRFGEERVSYDPSDPEANQNAYAHGSTVVTGSQLGKSQWDNLKRAGGIESAGTKFPTPKPYSDDPNAKPANILTEAQMTDGMKLIRDYAKWVAEEAIGIEVEVAFVKTKNDFAACCGRTFEGCASLDFNVQRLGQKWFQQGITAIDDLLIHELGHYFTKSHLDPAYHKALTRIGAALKRLAVDESRKMRRFIQRGEEL